MELIKKSADGGWLVCWKDMQKNSDEPLPMRPFENKELAEAYVSGCVDVIVISSKRELDMQSVRNDFLITASE